MLGGINTLFSAVPEETLQRYTISGKTLEDILSPPEYQTVATL